MANIFSLEAVKAYKGDCLLLHYGDGSNPKLILIDGGAKSTYREFLKPRLEQLAKADEPTKIRMLMVSHIDDDHIKGILDLFKDMEKAQSNDQSLPYQITSIWHNSFDDLLGNSQIAAFDASGLASTESSLFSNWHGEPDGKAVLASVSQGRQLRDVAKKFVLDLNGWFGDLIRASYDADKDTANMGQGLSLRVIAPADKQLRELQSEWDKKLKAMQHGTASVAELAAYIDKSAYNLSSIVVMAKSGGKTMLLTGDARGDHILDGLDKSGLLENGRIEVDVLKMPHHGSDHNVETDFFRRVRAKHYVFSGNGEHDNPEIATLRMIVDAVGNEPVDLYFTYNLDDRHNYLSQHAPAYRLHYPADGKVSVQVSL